jgi:transketolase
MRTAFFKAVERAAESDDRICVVTGDLGFGVVETFAKRFPKQFLNAGVAEQNMTGVAAGLALSGKIVFTYSIANFPTLRCLEQIRNDICYHNADVKVVSVGGGFSYGSLGASHHATEDLAILRSLPRMAVIAPGDPLETEMAVKALVETPGPCYLRLGRAGEPAVHEGPIDFEVGRAITVRKGEDVTLISTGGMLYNTLHAARALELFGIRAGVLSMHTLKPLDEEAVARAAAATGAIVTVEEHSILGGLGGAVAEVLAESGILARLKRIGLPSTFMSKAGSQEYLKELNGLSVEGIVGTVRTFLGHTAEVNEEDYALCATNGLTAVRA